MNISHALMVCKLLVSVFALGLTIYTEWNSDKILSLTKRCRHVLRNIFCPVYRNHHCSGTERYSLEQRQTPHHRACSGVLHRNRRLGVWMYPHPRKRNVFSCWFYCLPIRFTYFFSILRTQIAMNKVMSLPRIYDSSFFTWIDASSASVNAKEVGFFTGASPPTRFYALVRHISKIVVYDYSHAESKTSFFYRGTIRNSDASGTYRNTTPETLILRVVF